MAVPLVVMWDVVAAGRGFVRALHEKPTVRFLLRREECNQIRVLGLEDGAFGSFAMIGELECDLYPACGLAFWCGNRL